MAAMMIGAEVASASTFMGTSLKTSVQAGPARVTMMAYSRSDLEKKPLALLRVLARQQGVRGTSKAQLVNGLLGINPTYSTSYSTPSYYHSAPSFAGSAASEDEKALTAMSLGELRALAKARGLRGDTKAEIIKLLISSGGVSTPSSSSSFSSFSSPAPAAAASPALPAAVLERKSLSELRAMARIRGVRGDTKAELVKLLAAPGGAASSNGASNSAPSSSGNGSYKSNGAANPTAARLLATKSLSQLRAIAAVKGIRGTTKDELVKQLAALS